MEALPFDNMQFIYELRLALLEAKALGAKLTVSPDLKSFKILNSPDIEKLIKRSAYLKKISNTYTHYHYITQQNITRSPNQYLTHWMYPYKGKFHPQMVRALINIIGLKEGDTLLDPFSGSGTTAVEAQLLGINYIGVDISPLCVIQGKTKTEAVKKIKEIKMIKNYILKNPDSIKTIKDETAQNFYTLAKLIALSDKERRKRDERRSFEKNVDLMIASLEMMGRVVLELGIRLGDVRIELGDARELTLNDESVDGIITSPPYSTALDYIENDRHALTELGCDIGEIREKTIGVRGRGGYEKIKNFKIDIERAYREMYRVLKGGGGAAVVVGSARFKNEDVKTDELTKEIMQNIGFVLEEEINKTIFGLYNRIKEEKILIFRKV